MSRLISREVKGALSFLDSEFYKTFGCTMVGMVTPGLWSMLRLLI